MVGESSLTRTYASLLTDTVDTFLGTGILHDNVFNNDPTLQRLRTGERIKVIDGGVRIRVPILFEGNSTFKWYADYENLNVTPQEGLTTAWYTWKQGAVSISIAGSELRRNMGDAEVRDLAKDKMTQAELSMTDNVATGVFSDGTGTSNKQLTGLEAMIATTTTSGTYADINTANNTAWRNQAVASVGAAAANFIPNLRTQMNNCSEGKGAATKPDFVVTTQTVHEAFESLMTPRVRYQPNPSGGADAGIEKLLFKGAEVYWDSYCTSGAAYILNSNHIMMFVHRQANFALAEEGFQRPIDQDALVTQILFHGNMATNNRRKLGKLTGIT